MGWMNRRPAGRAGLTLVEVLIALAIFLVGSVSIIGLFVTASALHKDAVQRRTASYIAEGLLAEARGTPFREVFAKTRLLADLGNTLDVQSTEPDFNYQGATFSLWPTSIAPEEERGEGPLLLGREWIWYTERASDSFSGLDRPLWDSTQGLNDDRVLQPRTWVYVLDQELVSRDDDPNVESITVRGDPSDAGEVPAPARGYIVLDTEWIRYTARDADSFSWDASETDRGVGDTAAPRHAPGTPVTAAREHPHYPGYYYTVQFYPTNARGAHSKVTVSVGYGTRRKLRRAHFFHTVYTPNKF
ncbi:MAG: prepilin-type N-terminal cleavage/methylation domain-containing protein [Candidatus Brocadiia bacterium]